MGRKRGGGEDNETGNRHLKRAEMREKGKIRRENKKGGKGALTVRVE